MYPHITLHAVPRLLRSRNMLQQMAMRFGLNSRSKRRGHRTVSSVMHGSTQARNEPAQKTQGLVQQHTPVTVQAAKHELQLLQGKPEVLPRSRMRARNKSGTATRVKNVTFPLAARSYRSAMTATSGNMLSPYANHHRTLAYQLSNQQRLPGDRIMLKENRLHRTHLNKSAGTTVLQRPGESSQNRFNKLKGATVNQVLPHTRKRALPAYATEHLPLTNSQDALTIATHTFSFHPETASGSRRKISLAQLNDKTGSYSRDGNTTINLHRGVVEQLSVVTHHAQGTIDDVRAQVEQALLDILGNITTIR